MRRSTECFPTCFWGQHKNNCRLPRSGAKGRRMEGRKNANPKEGVHLGLSVFGRRKEKDKAKERPRKNKPYETAFDESFLIKKQKEFRKTFGFAEDEEIVASTYMTPCHFKSLLTLWLQGFSCSMQGGGRMQNMVQGTLFITNSYVCFYSNWWANERKVCRLGFSSFSI